MRLGQFLVPAQGADLEPHPAGNVVLYGDGLFHAILRIRRSARGRQSVILRAGFKFSRDIPREKLRNPPLSLEQPHPCNVANG